MRARLFVVLALLISFAPAVAQSAYLGLFPATDDGYLPECNLVEQGSGTRDVAVVLWLGGTYLGAMSLAISSDDVNWIPLSVTSSWQLIGGASNFSVGFGSCQSGPIIIATVHYFDPGATTCGTLELGPAAGFGWDILVTCEETYEVPLFVPLTVNGIYDVPPGGLDPDCYCPSVSTEASTWGRVKALYGN